MNNPDSNNQLWTYKINSKIYIPLLMYANNAVHEVAFNVENFNDMLYLKSIKSKLGFSRSTYYR